MLETMKAISFLGGLGVVVLFLCLTGCSGSSEKGGLVVPTGRGAPQTSLSNDPQEQQRREFMEKNSAMKHK
jgi:hypothetical protein